jgi:hypothetical protein
LHVSYCLITSRERGQTNASIVLQSCHSRTSSSAVDLESPDHNCHTVPCQHLVLSRQEFEARQTILGDLTRQTEVLTAQRC